VKDEAEYLVEEILDERRKRWGRGYRHQYLIKWIGYAKPTWEPAQEFEKTTALDTWEAKKAGKEREADEEGGNVTGQNL
jgi:hypothetical protein